MNNVSLIGRLTADPELRHTQSDIAMTRFTIAVDRPFSRQGEDRQADFITIVAWRQQAEFICKYFSKGRRIAITGQIRTGNYTDQNGTKHYTTEVYADRAEFCDSKNESSSSYSNSNSYSSNNYQQTSRPEPPKSNTAYSSGDTGDFIDTPNDDDLPF